MRKLLALAFCGLLLASCGATGEEYVIEGTMPSARYDGEWIYLVPMENAPGRVDSAKVTNAAFTFRGKGEEMRVLRMRHALRILIQELLVVTEPGKIHVEADSIGSVSGTPQNDALQQWKTAREQNRRAYAALRRQLKEADPADSLRLNALIDSLRNDERDRNDLFIKAHYGTTLGHFMEKTQGRKKKAL